MVPMEGTFLTLYFGHFSFQFLLMLLTKSHGLPTFSLESPHICPTPSKLNSILQKFTAGLKLCVKDCTCFNVYHWT